MLNRLTRATQTHNILYMNDIQNHNPSSELESLESHLSELLSICQQLKEENKSLRSQQESLIADRAALIEKNQLARSRVEAMISRLKVMENST